MIERNMQKADMENEGKNVKQINRPEKNKVNEDQ